MSPLQKGQCADGHSHRTGRCLQVGGIPPFQTGCACIGVQSI